MTEPQTHGIEKPQKT